MSFGESATTTDAEMMGQQQLATQGPTTLTDEQVKAAIAQAQHNAMMAYKTVMAQTGNPAEAERAAQQAASMGLPGNISSDLINQAAEQGITRAENPMNATPGQAADVGTHSAEQGHSTGVASLIMGLAGGMVAIAAANEMSNNAGERQQEGQLAAQDAPEAPAKQNSLIKWAQNLFKGDEGPAIMTAGSTLTPHQHVEASASGWNLASSMDSAATLSASNEPGRGLDIALGGAPLPTPQQGIAVAQAQQRDTGGRMRELNG